MSVVTVQFGQCGNQIGHELFSLLSKDCFPTTQSDVCRSTNIPRRYSSDSINTWFESSKGTPVARATLVDTEQKVTHDIYRRQKVSGSLWTYSEKYIVSPKGGGAGNNWAYGYHEKGPEMCENILESVRKQAEKCDRVLAVMNLLSSSGGTGPGVGSYVIEKLCDEYPTQPLVSCLVIPYNSGEVTTQNLNTLLTLAKLYDVTDMFVVFQNDLLHTMCGSQLKLKTVNFKDLNGLVAVKLASVFQPVENCNLRNLTDIVPHLVSHPRYKLATIKTAPHTHKEIVKFETKYSWKILFQHMKKSLRKNILTGEHCLSWETKLPSSTRLSESSLSQYFLSVANIIITRGPLSTDIDAAVSQINNPTLYPRWVPKESRVLHLHQNKSLLNTERFITLISNNQMICQSLDCAVGKAWNAFLHKAYLHHYSKFNLEEDHFEEAFRKIESVLKDYGSLSVK